MKQKINCLCVALMICSRAMTHLLYFPRSSVYVMLLALAVVLMNSARNFFNKNKIIFSLYVVFFFLATFVLCGENSTTIEYFLYFIVFGLSLFLMPYCFDFRWTLRFVLLIGIILLWSYLHIDYVAINTNIGGEYENVSAILMDISYKTLVFVITGLIAAVLEEKWYMKVLALAVALPYMIISFMYGARGALLSVTVFVLLLWLIRAKSQKVFRKRIALSIVACILVWGMFPVLISLFFSILEAYGFEARSVERLYDAVISNSSMSLGRELLAKKAFAGIIDSPIWGNGIGSFDNFSGVYPHNMILQLLYEGGILLAFPLLFLLGKGFMTMLDMKYDSYFRFFLLMLFCSGIIELFLSSHLWMSLFYWLFLGLSLLRKKFVIVNNTIVR